MCNSENIGVREYRTQCYSGEFYCKDCGASVYPQKFNNEYYNKNFEYRC